MTEGSNFRRVVLGLHHDAPRRGLRLAAEVAALLQVELCGLFIQEDLAALPFAREFRPLGGGWRTLDLDEIAEEVKTAASLAQRSFAEAVKGLGLSCHFEIVQGSMTETIASISRTGDIIVVYEPANPADRITFQSQSMIKAALGSAAAVLLVPRGVERLTGAVVALASNRRDPSAAAGAAIAALASEKLIVIEAFDERDRTPISENATAAPAQFERMSVPKAHLLHAAGVSAAFRLLQERLVVMTRGSFDDAMPAMIASTRRVPVLLIEPAVEGSSVRSPSATA